MQMAIFYSDIVGIMLLLLYVRVYVCARWSNWIGKAQKQQENNYSK